MESYIPFTEEQREQARRTDLAAFLRQQGQEVKRSGSEFVWLDHGQRVTIRGNLWFHQYEQVGGDAIDFACRFYGMGYQEAVQLMQAMLTTGVGTVQGTVEPFAKQPLELPPKHENMRRVYGYLLRRRGIDKDVLDAFAYRGLVYESTDYHNSNNETQNVFYVYGTEGILMIGGADSYSCKVRMLHKGGQICDMPFTHGYEGYPNGEIGEFSWAGHRGIGIAEMAWSIRQDRFHRASGDMALHAMEVLYGIDEASETGSTYIMKTTFTKPRALPSGYLSYELMGSMKSDSEMSLVG